MSVTRIWIRIVSLLVPADEREDWVEEWCGELVVNGGRMTDAWGALSDAWYLRWDGWTMDAMWRDMRTALKGLARKPFFTALAGITLAVGIGANTAIFSVVDGVLINPLPFPASDRMVSYNFTAPQLGVDLFPHSEGSYIHFSDRARTLDGFAVVNQVSVNVIADGEPGRLGALMVTQGFHAVTGVQPILGRGFAPGDDRLGADPTVILGHAYWTQAFGQDRDAVGTLLEVNGIERRIVGVMPARFSVLGDEQLFLPIPIDETSPEVGSFGLIGVARLADDSDVEAAGVEMNGLLTLFAEAHPDEFPPEVMEQSGLTADVRPLKDLYVEDIRQALWVLLGTVGFVLLIACANVANLFLVRAEGRQREQAVRTAIGASRLDMIRLYLTEAVALAVGGGLLGLALAAFGVKGLLALAPADLPSVFTIGIDGSVLAFTGAISLGSGLLFGLFPVLGYGRPHLTSALKEGGRSSTTGRDRHRARSALVVTQVALALILLVGSGLMVRSFVAMRSADLGFDHENRLTFRVGLPEAEYPEPLMTAQFYRDLQDRLAGVPGVLGVGMISALPLTDSRSASPMEPVDRPFAEGELGPLIERRQVTPGYFETMGIELIDGRELTWNDGGNAVRAVVVSEALAATFWPDERAVGRMLRSQGSENAGWEVVGVARDVRIFGVQTDPDPLVYLPTIGGAPEELTATYGMAVVMKTGADPLRAVSQAREALRVVDARLPMIDTRALDEVVRESMSAVSFTVVLLGIAAAVALVLGTVGIYGVISYIVSRRTQEIGVRMALGAPAPTVLKNVVGQGLRLTAAGVGIGLLGSWGLSRAVASLLFGVSPTDPATFGGMALLLTAVATLAAWVPARRASRVDPVEALRSE